MSEEPMTEAQRDAAATWLVRRQAGPLSPADEAAFRSWIAADPRHAEALGEAEALWRQLEEPGRRLADRFAADGRRQKRRGWLATLLRPLVALPAAGRQPPASPSLCGCSRPPPSPISAPMR